MQFKVKTFNPQNPIPDHSLFILSKGLNSGKVVDKPTTNCFVLSFSSQANYQSVKPILEAMSNTKTFQEYLVGSVIPFLRINDFKKALKEQLNTTKLANENTRKAVQSLDKLAELQKAFRQNLLLIKDAQKALYMHILRNK
ncbi:MAG: hypothetical protein U0V04_07345 [Spirosomataceae bacterium]